MLDLASPWGHGRTATPSLVPRGHLCSETGQPTFQQIRFRFVSAWKLQATHLECLKVCQAFLTALQQRLQVLEPTHQDISHTHTQSPSQAPLSLEACVHLWYAPVEATVTTSTAQVLDRSCLEICRLKCQHLMLPVQCAQRLSELLAPQARARLEDQFASS